jgi:hypothetical protein
MINVMMLLGIFKVKPNEIYKLPTVLRVSYPFQICYVHSLLSGNIFIFSLGSSRQENSKFKSLSPSQALVYSEF